MITMNLYDNNEFLWQKITITMVSVVFMKEFKYKCRNVVIIVFKKLCVMYINNI